MIVATAPETRKTPPMLICKSGEYKEPTDKVIIVKRGGIEVERKVQIAGKVRALMPGEVPIFQEDLGLIGFSGYVYYYHLIGFK